MKPKKHKDKDRPPKRLIIKFCISQPKGSESTATVTATQPEVNLQNLSPNIVSAKQQQQQQIIQNVQSSGSNNNNSKQSANAHVRDLSSPYQQQQQQQQPHHQQSTSQQQTSTPSLVVSVPLSTANVPGVNLNLSTSSSSSLSSPVGPPNLINQSGIGGGNNIYALRNEGNMGQNRHSPVVQSTHNHHPPILERQSPLVVQQRNASPAVHPMSPIDQSSSSVVMHHHSNVNLTEIQGNSSMLKVTYEKQTTNRLVAAIHEDDSSRRSRSQSIDDIGTANHIGSGSNNVSGNGGGSGNVNAGPTKSKGRSSKKGRNASNNNVESQQQQLQQQQSGGNQNDSVKSVGVVSTPLTNNSSSTLHGSSNNAASNPNTNGGGASILSQQLQNQPKIRRTPTIEQSPPSTSRTPEVIYTSNSSSSYGGGGGGGGLKFGYEAQTPSNIHIAATTTTTIVAPVQIKDSPPSSPGSEAGGNSKKRLKKQHNNLTSVPSAGTTTPTDNKDSKLFQNGVNHAAHMLGNQLNPSSSMAQKMSDTLNQEMEAHMAHTVPESTHHVGPLYPGKLQQNRAGSLQTHGPLSLSSMLSGAGPGNVPQNLEQLLERQWEQGSQFLMEQAQHFDIASLLSCLHQLKSENVRLEEHVTSLVARRDHLLAVNARLAIPLNPPVGNQAHFNNMHPTVNGPTTSSTEAISGAIASGHVTTAGSANSTGNSSSNRQRSGGSQSQGGGPSQQFSQGAPPSHQLPLENGIDFRHSSGGGSTVVTTAHTTGGSGQQMRHSNNQSYSSSSSGRQSSSSSSGRGSSSSHYMSQQQQQQQQQQVYASHQTVVRRDEGGVKPS